MKCPYCLFINPDDAKFCQQCGKPIDRICPNCNTHNDSNARFCKNCGKSLQSPNELTQNNTKTNDTSPQSGFTGIVLGSVPKLGHSAAHLTGERRTVTVLFADVVDSTSLAEQMDAEDWTTIMNRAFDVLTLVITHYEGTIARLMGDAILAFYGAPIAHEDDPVRAGQAALDLIEVAKGFAQDLKKRYEINFRIRVGINTGPVVVGEVGSNLAYEYTAMGDTVNLAARMQSSAQPMTVLITEKTYGFVAHAFQCIDLGRIAVKGKTAPVHVYELIKPRLLTASNRSLNEQAGIVGRVKELEILMQLSQTVEAGLGRAVLVVGEPGIGKSRLISEWRYQTEKLQHNNAKITWVESHSLSYGRGMAYQLLVDLMYSILNIRIGTSMIEVLTVLQKFCEKLFGNENYKVFPFLGHLMSLPLEDDDLERVQVLDPQMLQAHYLTSLRLLITALAVSGSLYIVLDDIQWADSSSIDLLIQLVPLISETSIMFCIASRPEREVAGWRLVENLRGKMGASLTEINLVALTGKESGQLISKLLDSTNIPQQAINLICGSSDGNPLFVEEVTHMLIDRKILVRQDQIWHVAKEIEALDIPDNLQSLLLARLDQLPADLRQTLRVASIIGRQFTADVLEKVLNRLGSFKEKKVHLAQLVELEASGLIALSVPQPEIEYTFRHALIQEAVYSSLLKSEQHELHLLVGEVLEEIHADHLVEIANRLAEHFWRAEQPQRALPYLLMSAEQASISYANSEAIENYSRALKASEEKHLPVSAILRARGELYEIIGQFDLARNDQEKALALSKAAQDQNGEWQALINLGALWSARDYQQTGAYYLNALALARNFSDDRVLATSLNRVGNYYVNVVNPIESQKSHQEALNIFTRMKDEKGIAETNDLLGMSNAMGGNSSIAFDYFTKAVALFEKIGDLRSLSSSMAAKSILASGPQSDTYISPNGMTSTEALQMAERSLQIARDIGWRSGQVFSLCVLVENLLAEGRFDRALECMRNAVEIVHEIQHRQWQTYVDIVSGMFDFELFAFDKAKDDFESALATAELSHSTHWIHVSSGLLATTLIKKKDLNGASALLEKIQSDDIPMFTMGGRLIWAARAELELANGDSRRALAVVKLMMEATSYSEKDVAVRLWMLRAEAFMALAEKESDASKRQDILKKAEQYLSSVLSETQSINYRSKIWQIHKALAKLYRIQNRQDESEVEQKATRKFVLELAETIGDQELRENYIQSAKAI